MTLANILRSMPTCTARCPPTANSPKRSRFWRDRSRTRSGRRSKATNELRSALREYYPVLLAPSPESPPPTWPNRTFVRYWPSPPLPRTRPNSHGWKARTGTTRVDNSHTWLDPVIVAGPWVVAGVALGKLGMAVGGRRIRSRIIFSNSMSHSCPLGHAYETGLGVVSEGSQVACDVLV